MEHVTYNMKHIEQGIEVIVREKQDVIDHATEVVDKFIKQSQEHLAHLTRTLQNLNPLNILKRGYSVVMKGGKVVKAGHELVPHDIVDARLYEGGFKGIIIESEA